MIGKDFSEPSSVYTDDVLGGMSMAYDSLVSYHGEEKVKEIVDKAADRIIDAVEEENNGFKLLAAGLAFQSILDGVCGQEASNYIFKSILEEMYSDN